ncbi:MAG: hypothetical protein DPW16_11915 [Chloroflexi bacterium]|nr:hypothetical protein [Chloroflexota bacterium]
MPNGGVMPCCAVCQYASNPPEDFAIECQKHKMKVTFAYSMFCADLSDPRTPGLASFIAKSEIPAGTMYMWAGMYTHQEYSFAPIETYATWSDEEKEKHFREKQADWESKYRSIYGDDAWF